MNPNKQVLSPAEVSSFLPYFLFPIGAILLCIDYQPSFVNIVKLAV